MEYKNERVVEDERNIIVNITKYQINRVALTGVIYI